MQTMEYKSNEAVIAHMILTARQLADKGEFEMEYHIDDKYDFTEGHVAALLKALSMRYGFETQLLSFIGKQYSCYVGWRRNNINPVEMINIRNELNHIAESKNEN